VILSQSITPEIDWAEMEQSGEWRKECLGVMVAVVHVKKRAGKFPTGLRKKKGETCQPYVI